MNDKKFRVEFLLPNTDTAEHKLYVGGSMDAAISACRSYVDRNFFVDVEDVTFTAFEVDGMGRPLSDVKYREPKRNRANLYA